MPLFRRSDGEVVKNLSPVRYMIPYVMRGRNESVVYTSAQWDITKARGWLRRYNRSRKGKERATIFHLLIYACVRMLFERPGVNRFVSGGRIYQRRGVTISFATKVEMSEDAPIVTVKLQFGPDESFDSAVTRIAAAIVAARAGVDTDIDREMKFFMKLPAWLLSMIVKAGFVLDRWNLLPKSLIEPDPMFCSMFLANMGSLHISNLYHHLYEYGTCSIFGVAGSVIHDDEGHDLLQVSWTVDERMNDGFYCQTALAFVRDTLADPDKRVMSIEEPHAALEAVR
ncbi:MAG: hypothetical protein QOK37_4753 [Thermoanaerobaculia bacterium]|jgi:hypothetical protein|nr:hypothetical protein [Thermoanaerobaculia bacterium]